MKLLKTTAAVIAAVIAAGCSQLMAPQTLSENYSLMQGAESNRPAFIDGDLKSAADSVFPTSGSSNRVYTPASEVYVTLPVSKTINRVKVHTNEIKELDLFVEDPAQGWKLNSTHAGLKGPVLDLKLKGIVHTSGVKLRIRKTTKDGSAYRENTQAAGGVRYISGNTRAAAKIYEIEIYGAGPAPMQDDATADAGSNITIQLEGMDGSKAGSSASNAAVEPPRPNAEAAPNFNLPSLDGENIQLSDYRGRVVLINFWATWCPPCVAEMPALQAVRDELSPRGFEALAISLDRDSANQYQTPAVKEKVQNFVTDHGLTFPVLLADAGVSSAYGGIRSIPTSIVVDANGNIVAKHVGGMNRYQFKQLIEKAYGDVE